MNNSEILKKTSDFKNVYKNGKSKANKKFVMYILKNDLSINRIGISVSKKIGNSVVRHHMTRLIKEAYRLHEDMFDIGFDIVVVVRNGSKKDKLSDVDSSLIHVANLHNIIKD